MFIALLLIRLFTGGHQQGLAQQELKLILSVLPYLIPFRTVRLSYLIYVCYIHTYCMYALCMQQGALPLSSATCGGEAELFLYEGT